jgi:hypothetical protein
MKPYERSELGGVGEGLRANCAAHSPLQVRLAAKAASLPILSPEGEDYEVAIRISLIASEFETAPPIRLVA